MDLRNIQRRIIMWAIDWHEMGCTQYADTIEDAHKIGERSGMFYIITYMGGQHGSRNII